MCWALRDVIDEFISLHGTVDLLEDQLTDIEWATIRVIKDFLGKLTVSTKACESSESTLDLVLPYTDYILQIFEKHKNEYKDDPTFASMFNSGWKKMDKYYKLLDKSPAYVTAIVLHPSRKWRWIEKHWKAEWIPSAKEKMKTFWETKYKPDDEALITSSATASTLLAKPPNEFLQWIQDKEDDTTTRDEYLRYCALPQVPGVTQGYKWWLEPTQQKNFLYLSKMAIDILSIPAMSADPERLFSGAKITISDRRNRLGIYTIEALECLKSWLKIQIFVDNDDDEDIRAEEMEDTS